MFFCLALQIAVASVTTHAQERVHTNGASWTDWTRIHNRKKCPPSWPILLRLESKFPFKAAAHPGRSGAAGLMLLTRWPERAGNWLVTIHSKLTRISVIHFFFFFRTYIWIYAFLINSFLRGMWSMPQEECRHFRAVCGMLAHSDGKSMLPLMSEP